MKTIKHYTKELRKPTLTLDEPTHILAESSSCTGLMDNSFES